MEELHFCKVGTRVRFMYQAQYMKRTILKKTSNSPISKIQKNLWELCRTITKMEYGNTCYTCGKIGLEGSNWHIGHFIPKAACGANLKYDLRNLRPQCYHCNINLGGNGAAYYRNMIDREGKKYVDKLFADKQKTVKAYDHYLGLIDRYTKVLDI